MNFSTQLKEAFLNLIGAKLRTTLALLGILIGVASVVALVSSGQLATRHALDQFKTLGTDLLAVSINSSSNSVNGAGSQSAGAQLTLSDVDQLYKATDQIQTIAPYTTYFAPASYKGRQLQTNLIGTTSALQKVVKIEMAQGRFVSDLDHREYYCVVGAGIAEQIGENPQNLIGKQIRVGNNIYTIIGVAAKWPENIFLYADLDHSLIIPIDNSFLLSKYVQIQNIVFKLNPGVNPDPIQAKITNTLNSILPGQQLFFRSAKQLIVSMEKQRQTLTLLLSLIGGISLVVGGIGVMNIMLVSVIERRKEIGIRMAVGATQKDIAMMFLIEAIVLTSFGGLSGIIIGILISYIAAEVSHWQFYLFLLPPLIGFVTSALVGIFSGFYPAFKAAKLSPIETLRSE